MMNELPEWWMQRGPAKEFLAHRTELYLWPGWPRRRAEIGEVTLKGIREVYGRIERRAARDREKSSESPAASGQTESAGDSALPAADKLFDNNAKGEDRDRP